MDEVTLVAAQALGTMAAELEHIVRQETPDGEDAHQECVHEGFRRAAGCVRARQDALSTGQGWGTQRTGYFDRPDAWSRD